MNYYKIAIKTFYRSIERLKTRQILRGIILH